jgi:hypothetical protein
MKNSIPPREARAFSNINNDSMRAMLLSFMISFFFLLHSLIVDCFFFLRSKKYQMQTRLTRLWEDPKSYFAARNKTYSKNKTNKQTTNKQAERTINKRLLYTQNSQSTSLSMVYCVLFLLNWMRSRVLVNKKKQNKLTIIYYNHLLLYQNKIAFVSFKPRKPTLSLSVCVEKNRF